jgi:Spy/CpxP family protein refolding chaperone
MKRLNPRLAAAVGAVSLAALGASAIAYAQAPAAPAPAAREAGHHHGRHHERRAQLVHDALNLRPDQEAAWNAYRAALTSARPARGEHARPAHALTTPERLDRMQQRMAARQAAFARRAEAARRFYAALDPAQQKAFDAVTQLSGREGGRHHGGRRGHGMGPMRGHGPGAPASAQG